MPASMSYAGASLTRTGLTRTGSRLSMSRMRPKKSIVVTIGSDLDEPIIGYVGPDSISGGLGNDLIRAGSGNDTLIGGGGNDTIDGGAGIDTLDFSQAPEGVAASIQLLTPQTISASLGVDVILNMENIIGGDYNDTISGNTLDNILTGNTGNDYLSGGAGHDTIFGGVGNDSLFGNVGDDLLIGGDGNDYFAGAATGGSDTFDGGTGIDELNFSVGTAAVTVDLGISDAQYVGGGTKTIINIEKLTGGNFNDVLTGNDSNNTISGMTGNDTITGESGADVFIFNTALNATTNVDVITDFEVGVDKIYLSKSIFAIYTIGGPVTLGSYLYYDQPTGVLSYSPTLVAPGRLVIPVGAGADFSYSSAIQQDGKLVFAGKVLGVTNDDFGVIRLNPDGSLDTSFGVGGKVIQPVGTGVDQNNGLLIQADGKIILTGQSTGAANDDFSAIRLNTDGTLDSTYGTGGKAIIPVGTGVDQGRSSTLQPDGKLIIIGVVSSVGNYNDYGFVRLNTDGSLDTTFGAGGKAVIVGTGTNEEAYHVNVQSDGKILAMGYEGSSTLGTYNFGALRLNQDGTKDTTFGTNGKVLVPIGGVNRDQNYWSEIQSDGKIVLAGYVYVTAIENDFGVIRLNPDGSLDTSFGVGGKVIQPVGVSNDYAFCVKIQPDGKLVVAGWSVGTTYEFSIIRLNPDGSLDTSFGVGGKVIQPVGVSNDVCRSIVIQDDGKIVAAGWVVGSANNNDFGVIRLNTDGSLDTTFGTNSAIPVAILGTSTHPVITESDFVIVA